MFHPVQAELADAAGALAVRYEIPERPIHHQPERPDGSFGNLSFRASPVGHPKLVPTLEGPPYYPEELPAAIHPAWLIRALWNRVFRQLCHRFLDSPPRSVDRAPFRRSPFGSDHRETQVQRVKLRDRESHGAEEMVA